MMMTTVMMSRIFAFSTKHHTSTLFLSIMYISFYCIASSIIYFIYIVTIIMVYMSNSDNSSHIQGKKISSLLWKPQKKKDENTDSFSNWIWFSQSIKPHPGCDWLKTPQLIKALGTQAQAFRCCQCIMDCLWEGSVNPGSRQNR